MPSDRKEQFFRCCPDCGALTPYFQAKCDCGRRFHQRLPRGGRLWIAAAIILSVSLAFAVYYIFWQQEALPLQYAESIGPFITQKEEAAYDEGYAAGMDDGYAEAQEDGGTLTLTASSEWYNRGYIGALMEKGHVSEAAEIARLWDIWDYFVVLAEQYGYNLVEHGVLPPLS